MNRALGPLLAGLTTMAIACPDTDSSALAPARQAGDNQGNAAPSRHPADALAFERVFEPRERAFSILVPRGWRLEGGIYRVNAATAGGPLNAIEAKCDLTISDPSGQVSLRVLPDIVYAHTGIGGGFFAPGSSYQGATVRALPEASALLKALFRDAFPAATEVEFVQLKRLPGEVELLDRSQRYTNELLRRVAGEGMTFTHDAAGGVVDFSQGGVRYRAAIVTALVNMRAALTWKNTRALVFRAPRAEFDRWRPVLDIVRGSTRFNPKWILSESKGQQQRADFVMKIYDQVRQIDQEILSHQRVNREEIMNDNYLVLTGQEEFANPHSGETEVDTDAYRYRWSTPDGQRYYSNSEDDDPNLLLQRDDYQRTPARKRRNE